MTEIESKNLLARVFIASPCSASWDAMDGTDRVRNCGDCSRKVFNLSDMSSSEAEEFLKANGTSQCLTFYRRKDGTIMTDDCPVGLRKIRNAARRVQQIAALFMGAWFSAVAATAQTHETNASSDSETPVAPIKRFLWRKPEYLLKQLGTPCVSKWELKEYSVPSFSELRSGQYAVGKNLVERQGRIFVLVGVKMNLSAKYPKEELLERVPSSLTVENCDMTAKILEVQGHLDAAETFHKIYMNTFKSEGYVNQQIASNYRDFLFRQKRIEEARKIEYDCFLEPEKIFEGCKALQPLPKKMPVDVRNLGWYK